MRRRDGRSKIRPQDDDRGARTERSERDDDVSRAERQHRTHAERRRSKPPIRSTQVGRRTTPSARANAHRRPLSKYECRSQDVRRPRADHSRRARIRWCRQADDGLPGVTRAKCRGEPEVAPRPRRSDYANFPRRSLVERGCADDLCSRPRPATRGAPYKKPHRWRTVTTLTGDFGVQHRLPRARKIRAFRRSAGAPVRRSRSRAGGTGDRESGPGGMSGGFVR